MSEISTNKTLGVSVISAEAEIFSGIASMLYISGEIGELGVAPGHSPLLTYVKPGEMRIINPEGNSEIFYISGGLLEVQPYTVTVLADTVLRAADIDEVAATAAKDRAENILINKQSEIEYATALIELAQATAQLKAIQNLRKQR